MDDAYIWIPSPLLATLGIANLVKLFPTVIYNVIHLIFSY